MKVCVMSRLLAEEYSRGKHDESSVLISIASKEQPDAEVSCNEDNNLKDKCGPIYISPHLIGIDGGVLFDPLEGFVHKQNVFTFEEVKEFVNKYKDTDIDTLIVNCGAGQSRSAGVAAAILMYLTGSDRQIYDDKKYTPNRLCYSTVLKAFNGETDYASIFGGV